MELKHTSLFALFCTLSQAFDNSGICETSSHDGTSTKQFCCDFYENRTNGCVACEDGFESFHGTPCRPCQSNTYGNWCEKKCVCTTEQRCDHIHGCLDVIPTVDLYQGIVTTWTTTTLPENSRTDRPNEILSNFPIYLVLGMGIIVSNMFICALCTVYYKRKRHSNTNISNAALRSIEEANFQEQAYDEIDENAVMDEITNQEVVINQNDKRETSGVSGEDVQEHDYLTPYQPKVHYPNAIYKNLPLNPDIPRGSRTSDCFGRTYENTAIFN